MTCAHDTCHCEGVEGFDGYCSLYCAEVDRKDTGHGEGCECGHPPCGENHP